MGFDWDDIRVFLEVQRTGRLNKAARRLDLSHTTVARRLKRLEDRFGCPLFRPTESGLSLTEAGQDILDEALAMEVAAGTLSDRLERYSGDGTRRVRIGAPDGIGNAVLSGILADFVRSDPGFGIELVPIPATHKLWRRDVDIAISLDRPERGRIVMRKLIDYDLRLYAGPSYFGTGAPPATRDDLRAHPFVGYIKELLYTEELDFIRAIATDLRIVFRAATVHAQLDAVRHGVGLGVLPCFLARNAGVVPVMPQEVAFRRTYWMLFSEEYRAQDRIRRVTDFIHDQIAQRADQFNFAPGEAAA